MPEHAGKNKGCLISDSLSFKSFFQFGSGFMVSVLQPYRRYYYRLLSTYADAIMTGFPVELF